MSKRLLIYTNELPRDYDHLKLARWASIDSGLGMLDSVGGSSKGPGGFLASPALGLSPLSGFGGVTSTNPFSAPATNPGGAGGTSSGAPVLGALVNGATLNPGSGTTAAISVPIDVGTLYVMARTDATALPSAGAVQTTTLGLSTAAQNYSDISGSNTAVGVGSADNTFLLARCVADALNVTQTDGGTPGAPALPGTTAGPSIIAAGTAGHFTAYLVYALPVGSDLADPDDPNLQSGNSLSTIPYYNPSNPGTPEAGPGGNGVPQASLRANYAVYAVAVSSVTNNASAQTSINGLSLPAGGIPLYIFVANHTTTDISTAAYVWPVVAGGATPTGLTTPSGLLTPVSGFLSGHVQQHHLGIPGHAPKIDGGQEWLPLSTVNNNGQAIGCFPFLAGTGLNVSTPANNPPTYITSSLAAFVDTANCSVDSKATDGAGRLTIAFTSGTVVAGTNYKVGRIQAYSGLSPDSVLLFPSDDGSTFQAGSFFVNLTGAGPAPTGYWDIYFQPTTTSVATKVMGFSFLAIFEEVSMRKFLAVLLFSATALGQTSGARQGAVTWSGFLDGGWLVGDAGIQIYDAGIDVYDAGIQVFDAGIQVFDGGVCADGGLSCTACSGSCEVDAGIEIVDAGVELVDAGIQIVDAGIDVYDAGFNPVPFDHYTWIPVSSAIYEGVIYSDQIIFGMLTPGGCFAYFYAAVSAGATAGGTICLQQGGTPPGAVTTGFVDIPLNACQALDGGVGPYVWDIGPIHSPAIRFEYAPGDASDGGWLVGDFNTTQ